MYDQNQINEWLEQQKAVEPEIAKNVEGLKNAFSALQETLNKHETLTLKITLGKSSNDIYCLMKDLENIENLVFSVLSRANLSNGFY